MTLLSVSHIQKKYGKGQSEVTALQDVSFTIDAGEFVGIMGPSGAGKSTLLNLLATIDTPTAGSITMNDLNLHTMKETQLADFRREHLGFIFQDYNLLDSLTVKENILLPLAINKVKATDIQQRVQDIANVFGIAPLLEKYPVQLSGGQKQRTAAARALVTEPAMILADEPTGALDSKSATDLLESLQHLNEQKQATIMMVTHDAFAASFCERILFIQDGEVSRELLKGNQTRKQFFQQILQAVATFGGGAHDAI
jgi:putative ABC transport system ATP-binding protein